MNILEEIQLTARAWGILAGPAILLGLAVWLTLPQRWSFSLPPQRERAMPWTGWEVALALLAAVLLPDLGRAWMEFTFGAVTEEDTLYLRYLGVAISYPLVVALVLTVLIVRRNTRPYQLGIHAWRWRQGIVLGIVAWLLSTPLVEGTNILVSWIHWQWKGNVPKPHDLVKLVQGSDPGLGWTLLLLVALLLGTILEEFTFRGVLQRWMGKMAWRGHLILLLAFLLALGGDQLLTPTALFVLVLAPGFHFCPLFFFPFFPIRGNYPRPQIPRELSEGITEHPDAFQSNSKPGLLEAMARLGDPRWQDPRLNQPRAVYATAVFFASVHPWPTPVPLFLLGLLLGWCAWRTQSLVAPLTLHILFNAVACVELAMGL
jgi:membrane protease YdiL (CAAX protease family)